MFANALWSIHAKDEVVIDAAFALFGPLGLNISPEAVFFPRSSSPYQEADTRSSALAFVAKAIRTKKITMPRFVSRSRSEN